MAPKPRYLSGCRRAAFRPKARRSAFRRVSSIDGTETAIGGGDRRQVVLG